MPKIVDHDQRRREVAAAVLELVAVHGVGGVTLNEVAAQSGWSRGVLSHYFENKAALLEAALREGVRDMSARLSVVAVEADSRKAIRTMLEEVLPLDEAREAVVRVLASFRSEALVNESLCSYYVYNTSFWVDIVTRAIERGQANGEISGHVDARLAAELLTNAVEGLRERALVDSDLDPNVQQRKVADWIDSVLPPP